MAARIFFVTLTVAGVVCAPAMAAVGDGFIGALAVDRRTVWAGLNTSEMVRMDPDTGQVRSRTPTPAALDDLAIGPEGVWGVSTCAGPRCRYGALTRFDRASGRPLGGARRLETNPRAVALGGGSVWVLGDRRLLRIDPATSNEVASISIGRDAQDVAVGGGMAWVATGAQDGACRLVAVAIATGRVAARRRVPCLPRAVAYGRGRPWTTQSAGLPQSSVDLAIGFGRVWVAEARRTQPEETGDAQTTVAHVTGIDLRGGRPVSTAVARTPSWIPEIAVGAGGVWIANAPLGRITGIDPDSGRIAGSLRPQPGRTRGPRS